MKKSILMIAFCGFILIGLSYEILNDKHESISNEENIKQTQEQVSQKQVIEEVESQIKPNIADKNSDEFIENKKTAISIAVLKMNGILVVFTITSTNKTSIGYTCFLNLLC